MSIQRAEQLKRELTDKYVVVAEGVPELRRFMGRTGLVKTVNMNCRALVQFDAPEDIAWYDIDPSYLTVVDAPVRMKVKPEESPASADRAAPAKPAPKPAAGKSPLEMARQQGAGKAAEPAAAPAGGAKKLSPLELARQQGALKTGDAKPAAPEVRPQASANGDEAARTPAPQPQPAATEAPKSPAGKKLSPLELARMQDKKSAT